MYKVVEYFTDIHDNNYPYSVGDTFPRCGITVTAKRLKELSGSKNRRGCPVIERVLDENDENMRKAVRKAVEKKEG